MKVNLLTYGYGFSVEVKEDEFFLWFDKKNVMLINAKNEEKFKMFYPEKPQYKEVHKDDHKEGPKGDENEGHWCLPS